jgi:hypothetical protein
MLAMAGSEQRDDVTVDGKPMYVLAVVPAEGSNSKYQEVLAYFDKQSCIIRKVEFYAEEGTLDKVLSVDPDAIKTVQGVAVPHVFHMRDLKKNRETELTVTRVEIDPPIADAVFDPARIKESSGLD